MTLSFSRTVRFGLVRFNFTEQGIGVKMPIPGLGAGVEMRGAYIRGGLGRFHYRRSIGAPLQGDTAPIPIAQPRSSSPVIHDSNVIHTTEHEAKSILELQDSTSDALLQAMNEQRALHPIWPFAGAALLVLLALLRWATDWPVLVYLFIAAMFALGTGWLYWREQLAKLTVLFYEPDQSTATLFEQLCKAQGEVAKVYKLRSVASTSRYADPKYSAGAGHGVQLGPARLFLGHAPGVVANVKVPILASGKTTLAFYPDRILAFQENAVGSIEYSNLSAVSSAIRYVEKDTVAADSTVVDRTWLYVNKKGGPDRRFKNNRELPICAFSQIELSTRDGLDMRFVGSKQGCFDGIARALAAVRAVVRPGRDSRVEAGDWQWGPEQGGPLFKADH